MMISSSVLLSSPLGFVTAVSVTFPVTVKVYGLSVETREPFSVHSTNVSPLGTVAVTVTLVPSSNVPLVLPPESEPPITVTVYVTGCGSGSSSGLHPAKGRMHASARTRAIAIVSTLTSKLFCFMSFSLQ